MRTVLHRPIGQEGTRTMNGALLFTQLVNGLQYGLLLFLVAAGLTLVFGILDFVNLAHGAFYMLGAFVSASITALSGSWPLALLLSPLVVAILSVPAERFVARPLYGASPLVQVLATFGLLLVMEALAMIVWGTEGRGVPLPSWLHGHVEFLGVALPAYRILIVLVGLSVAVASFWLVYRTRFGMQVRAAAANRAMAEALGIDTLAVEARIFAFGAGLAALAGALVAPLSEANLAMAFEVIIIAFVVIIVGGLASLKGAFIAALLVGMTDTLGRAFLDDALRTVLSAEAAETAAPAISSMSIYLFMAVVLAIKPSGLFPPRTRELR